MSFIWPVMLLALLGLPAVVAVYVAGLRRRASRRAELAEMALVEAEPAATLGRRRHVPPVLLMAAVTLLLVGFARPEVVIALGRIQGKVVVAIDGSNSMAATDADPNRLDAARATARDFVERRPGSVDVAVVTFTDGAVVTQPATDLESDVLDALERVGTQGSTSLGQGLFTAIGAIAGGPIPLDSTDPDLDIASIDIGFHSDSVILLISDGENRRRPDPIAVAELAANAGIKIYAVGVGTTTGATIEVDGYTLATALDEPLLQVVAEVTGGQYFRATDGADIDAVYDAIDLELEIDGEKTEVTALVGGLAALLLIVAAGLSQLWFGRAVP